MPAFVTTLLLGLLLLGRLVPALTVDAYAQSPGAGRGGKGPIGKEELRARVERQEAVDGYIIQGDDLIAIIRETTFAIEISNSIIEGGLDFTALPATPVEHVELPTSWSDTEQEAWRARQRSAGVKDIHVAVNSLHITATDMGPQPQASPHVRRLALRARTTLFQEMVFEKVSFSSGADFEGASFSGRAEFWEVSFSTWVDFKGASFPRGASFGGASFSGRVEFGGASFNGWAGFRETGFLGEARFQHASFSGEGNFEGASFKGGVDFWRASFNGPANFRGSRFQGASAKDWADFRGASFSSLANFVRASFCGEAKFRDASFSSRADFGRASFRGPADFQAASFKGEAGFEGTNFRGGTGFSHAKFALDANFSGAAFGGPSSYQSAEFSSEALFHDAHFATAANFVSARFKGLTSFWRMTAEGPAVFINARFGDRALFKRAQFSHVTFTAEGNLPPALQNVISPGEAAPLLPAIFLKAADFRDATFTEARFSGVSFEEVDFTGADFTQTLSLTAATYRRLTIDELPFERLDPRDKDTLRRLEANFRAPGQLELANQAFYQRKITERGEKPAHVRIGELMLLDGPAGYGVRPLRTVIASTGLIVLFAFLYHAADVVRYRVSPKDANFRFRLTDIPIISMESEESRRAQRSPIRSRMRRLWDALYFSFSVYTKLGTGRRIARKWQGVVIAEWLVGLLMFAVLFYTLSNTVPVLQRLLSAVV